MSVEEAKKKLEDAQKAAEAAKKELKAAEKIVKAGELADLFEQIDCALFDYHRFDFEDEDVRNLRESLSVLRGEFSKKAFGSGKYLDKLNKLDETRWPLAVSADRPYTTQSCIADQFSRLTTDQNVAYDVATWMFDNVGSHPNRWDESFDPTDVDVSSVYPRMVEALGQELAELSLKTWTAGHHDT